jgi:hypothetical protein
MEDLHTQSKAEVGTQTHTSFCHTSFCHTSFCHTFPGRIWRSPTLSELISCCLLLQTAQMPQVVGTMGLAELDRWLDAADTASYNDACRSFRSGKKHVAMESSASGTRERQAQHVAEVGGAADRFAQYLMNFYYQVRAPVSSRFELLLLPGVSLHYHHYMLVSCAVSLLGRWGPCYAFLAQYPAGIGREWHDHEGVTDFQQLTQVANSSANEWQLLVCVLYSS